MTLRVIPPYRKETHVTNRHTPPDPQAPCFVRVVAGGAPGGRGDAAGETDVLEVEATPGRRIRFYGTLHRQVDELRVVLEKALAYDKDGRKIVDRNRCPCLTWNWLDGLSSGDHTEFAGLIEMAVYGRPWVCRKRRALRTDTPETTFESMRGILADWAEERGHPAATTLFRTVGMFHPASMFGVFTTRRRVPQAVDDTLEVGGVVCGTPEHKKVGDRHVEPAYELILDDVRPQGVSVRRREKAGRLGSPRNMGFYEYARHRAGVIDDRFD